MKPPDTPEDEAARLETLHSLGVLDTPAEQAYDDIVRLAAQLFDVPIALVSLVDTDRQWFKARHGLDAAQTPRDVSFCGHAVADGEALVVPDAHLDPRFADNPLVTGAPNVRFYAGAPLKTSDGHTLGTLCVIDHEAREPTDAQLASLELLGRHVTAQLELRRRTAQSAFFDMTLDLLCIAGMDGYFKLLNPAWSRALGWSVEELLSKPFIEFVHPDDREATLAEAGKLATEDYETVSFQNRYQCADGSYRWLEWTAAPDQTGQLLHAVAHDITEKRLVEQMKNEFVSVVSHELRTPLTSIRGSLRLLEGGLGGELPSKARGLIEIASKNTDRLVRLINDILDLEKIEAGKLELTVSEIAPAALIQRSVEAMAGLATEMSVSLVVAADEIPNLDVDVDRLVQVMTNLLSNAIKFSPQGSQVMLAVRRKNGYARFSVTDEGSGISEADQLKLFEKFHQVDSSDTRAVGGTGLGLAIAKAIVLQHRGRIGVDSTPGEGASFWFEIPLTHASTPLPADLPSSGVDRLRHSVLIVEDDADLVHVLRLLITSQGYRVRTASSFAAARTSIEAEVPDAILLDLTLTDGDGMELVSWIRADARLSEIPILVTTGRARETSDFGDAILVDWLQKPVDEGRLLRALHQAVRRPGTARVLVAEDDDDAREVLANQLRTLGVEVFEASDGPTAIALAREHAPDLIVLDVGMPGVDGFDVVDVLKQTKTRSTPLVVYTGRDLNRDEREALQLGLTRHLTKARTTETEFSQAVVELLNGALSTRPPPPEAASGAPDGE